MTYEIKTNPDYNSLEVYFDGKPSEAVREALKALKFRWHSVKKCWYGYTDPSQVLEGNAKPAKAEKTTKAEPKRSHNFTVGSLLYCSWGYEQTNIDFFQVVELVGASSVRIRQVQPQILEEDAYSHGMAADRRYQIPDAGELLPSCSGIFIEDDNRGDLHRVITKHGGEPFVYVDKDGHYRATLYNGGTLYESWYY
jgi:hypothetical protein